MEYPTKTIGGNSPLNNLSPAQLKELVVWRESESYKILERVILEGELKTTANLVRSGTVNNDFLFELAKQQGKFQQLQSILNLPNSAQKILTKLEAENARTKRSAKVRP